jgi:ABC-2 type transport system permease protein
MNVYLYELKANRKFITTWLIVILSIGLVMLSFYPTIFKDMDAFIKMMENYPKNIRDAFGMNLNTMGSLLGYYSSFPLTFITICAAMEATILGVSILSKEIRDKTADFLFTKPLSRMKIITSKLLASISLLALSNLILIFGAYLLLLMFSKTSFSFSVFLLLTSAVFIIQLVFFAIGILVSVLLPKVKAPISISMAIVFGFYALGVIVDEKMRLINPFKYFDSVYIIENTSYELKYLLATFVVIVSSTVLTYIIYKKKDIHSV